MLHSNRNPLSMEALSSHREKRIDFFMSDSGLYAYEARTHGAEESRAYTPIKQDPSKASSSVVIVRADRHDLKVFEDLKGTTVVENHRRALKVGSSSGSSCRPKLQPPISLESVSSPNTGHKRCRARLASEADVSILKACDFEQLLTSHFRSSAHAS